MKTRFDTTTGVAVIAPEGDITVDTSPQLNTVCEKLVAEGAVKMVIDLARVAYIDSSGLATLVAILKKLKMHQGQLKVAAISAKVRGLFEITKLDKLFGIYASEEEALKSF